MEEIIVILLTILPGFIIRYVKCTIFNMDNENDEFSNNIKSLIYSLPVLLINLIVLRFYVGITNFNNLIKKFNNFEFVLKYLMLTLGSMILILGAIYLIEPNNLNKVLNKLRKNKKQVKQSVNENTWKDFFSTGEEVMPVEVIKENNVIASGFVKYWDNKPGDEKGVVLIYPEQFEQNKDKMKEVNRVYIDFKNDFVIREYKFEKDKFINPNNTNTSS